MWVENAFLGEGWHYSSRNIITGIPKNDWNITLPESVCVDVTPVGEADYAVRVYGYDDAFRGDICDTGTLFLGVPVKEWMAQRGILPEDLRRLDGTPCQVVLCRRA